MLDNTTREIIASSRAAGWVLEPAAKRLLGHAGLDVPRFAWATDLNDTLRYAAEIGFPVAAKVVSPDVVHKSEWGGVIAGIDGPERLENVYHRFSEMKGFAGILVEEMLSGLELILGAKIDYQFGPVILLGMGGTGVEIYRDTALRMAPLKPADVESMVRGLRARELLEGYRGAEPVSMPALTRMLMGFSALVMALENDIASIDLNPVFCTSERCVVADARIMLDTGEEGSRGEGEKAKE